MAMTIVARMMMAIMSAPFMTTSSARVPASHRFAVALTPQRECAESLIAVASTARTNAIWLIRSARL